jgi:hypothetical protein
MNPLSAPRQQQQKQKQKQKALRIKKQENTLEFHSRLIEAAEVRFPTHAWQSYLCRGTVRGRRLERRSSGQALRDFSSKGLAHLLLLLPGT